FGLRADGFERPLLVGADGQMAVERGQAQDARQLGAQAVEDERAAGLLAHLFLPVDQTAQKAATAEHQAAEVEQDIPRLVGLEHVLAIVLDRADVARVHLGRDAHTDDLRRIAQHLGLHDGGRHACSLALRSSLAWATLRPSWIIPARALQSAVTRSEPKTLRP